MDGRAGRRYVVEERLSDGRWTPRATVSGVDGPQSWSAPLPHPPHLALRLRIEFE